ncbi:hypothetical protein SBDP1_580026 [Syntrophobacter sp. SbD1]|nr:hypothetical protein SBDP1_580026 [Syntrophobacter sp. SbD1]
MGPPARFATQTCGGGKKKPSAPSRFGSFEYYILNATSYKESQIRLRPFTGAWTIIRLPFGVCLDPEQEQEFFRSSLLASVSFREVSCSL